MTAAAEMHPLKPGDDVLAVSRASGRITFHAVRITRLWFSLGGSIRFEGLSVKGGRPEKIQGDRRQCIALAALENFSAPTPDKSAALQVAGSGAVAV